MDVAACKYRANDESEEHNEHDEVEDGITNDPSASQFRLLERVDGRSDLATWSKPEEHDRVELVDVWNAQCRKHDEQNEVSENEVGSEQAELSDLANELTTRLRHGMPAHRVPLPCPPRNIGGILFEFTGEGQSNDQLEDEALESDNSDHSEQSLSEDPSFKEEHDFEESQEHHDGDTVGDGCKDSTELLAAHA